MCPKQKVWDRSVVRRLLPCEKTYLLQNVTSYIKRMCSRKGSTQKCPLGVFHALAFAADFPPVAPEFYQRTHRVRLKNLGTTDKKSSRKIKYKKIPRVHYELKRGNFHCPFLIV